MTLLLLSGCIEHGVQQLYSVDSWTQGEPNSPVDVLWVLDDSATMSEEQAAIAEHAQSFVEVLLEADVAFQIGVTTTDIDAQAGALRGPVIPSSDPDVIEHFAEQVDVGTLGSRDEQPLEAIRMATRTPFASDDNADLLRDDTFFAIVVVTDEDDHSREDIGSYLNHLDTLQRDFAIQALAGGLPEGCNSSAGTAEAAERLLEAVEATGGGFRSICERDYEPVLRAMGLDAVGLTDTFKLAAVPAVDSITVKIEGEVILEHVEGLEDDGWSYSPAQNAIVFHGEDLPPPGAYITCEYLDYGDREWEETSE
ncbi:MAG: hypothetical protein GY913_16425 [Proteobacteria bacterium]|nr:hypothetical protein [Pseudomonadota bacterium]